MEEDTVNSTLDSLVAEYETSKVRLKEERSKVEGIFDAEITTTTIIRREKEEKDKVKALVDQKGAFSASTIYTNIGTMCITTCTVLEAQRIQLEQAAKK